MDLVAVANACAVECVRQKVGLDRLVFLVEAYNLATNFDAITENRIVALAQIIEPMDNKNGYRRLPVTFASGGSSANASDIPRLVRTLVENIDNMTTDEFVEYLMWIHPFADGNGRLGFIVQNILDGTMHSPRPLIDHFG